METQVQLSQAELDLMELRALNTKQSTLGSGYSKEDHARKTELEARTQGTSESSGNYTPLKDRARQR